MKSLIHNPAVLSVLRPLKPVYKRVFGGAPDFSNMEPPRALIEKMDGRGVFLFSFARSGTTVFCDFLQSHPKVISYGEVLNENAFHSFFKVLNGRTLKSQHICPTLMQYAFFQYLHDLTQGAPGSRSIFDMKIETLHLIDGNWRMPGTSFDLFDFLLGTNAPVILLERKDLVARFLSGQIAQHSQQFHSFQTDAAAEAKPFSVDIEKLDREARVVREQMRVIREKFSGHGRFLDLTYEDLFEKTADGASRFSPRTVSAVADLLGVEDAFDATPKLSKLSRPDYRSLITNYEAIEAYRVREQA